MKRIGIEINGVLRDTIGKFTQLYEKHMIDEGGGETNLKTFDVDLSGNTDLVVVEENFKYEIKNEAGELLNKGETTLVFIDMKTNRPTRCPDFLEEKFKPYFN